MMSTFSDTEVLAVIRRDDATAARSAFSALVAERGRLAAIRLWVEATDRLESEAGGDPMLTPTRVAPDCTESCGESCLDEGCQPCTEFQEVRQPQRPATPFECACGATIAADQTEAILDHVEECPTASTGPNT